MHDSTRNATLAAALLVAVALASCGSTGAGRPPTVAEVKQQAAQSPAATLARAGYGAPARIATLEDPAVNESSGLVASRRNPGLFWTHNDSGDKPHLYAFDRAGRSRGVWRVNSARAVDWEDAAAGPGPRGSGAYLYVGDIGDNGRKRAEIVVYRIAEPEIPQAAAANSPRDTEPAEAIRLRYPDGSHDAEALLVHPSTGDIYIVTKTASGAAGVYKLAAPASVSSVNTLVRVAEVRLPGFFGGYITGGDISTDGLRVLLCDYLNAYEFVVPDGGKFDSVWGQPPQLVELGERRQGEAVCYGADGEAIYATSEKRPIPLIEVKRELQRK